MKFSIAFHTTLFSISAFTTASPLITRQDVTNQTMIHDFAELTPTPELIWTPCYENFTCTLLEVPLDYTNVTIGTTHIAIIKLSSQNASAEDLLVNSGGPGGSGVRMVLSNAEGIAAKVGTQYNLIGIDPRGVNNSGPNIACFTGYPEVARNAFYAEAYAVADDTSSYGLEKSFQTLGALGDWCTGVYSVNDTAKYISTVAVAHDFLHYIELAAQEKGCEPADAKLNYYAISYGTILGTTFASLFPDRIKRMVLDGVADSEDYHTGGWKKAVPDTDEALRTFFRTCFDAGPELCVFHGNSTSWEQLEERYNAILDSLKKAPIPVADPSSPTTLAFALVPAVVTWQDLVQRVLTLMYFPVKDFPILALTLAELEVKNGTSLHAAKQGANIVMPAPFDPREPRTLIACLDANGRFNTSTIEEFTEHLDFMKNESRYGGLALAAIAGPICHKLNVFPPESQAFDVAKLGGNTSAPILFIGNRADPVTPLRSAKRMSEFFPGSLVLAANTSGHSLFGIGSKCVDTYTQQYFLDASLPPSDTTCELDESNPFVVAAALAAALEPTTGPSIS